MPPLKTVMPAVDAVEYFDVAIENSRIVLVPEPKPWLRVVSAIWHARRMPLPDRDARVMPET